MTALAEVALGVDVILCDVEAIGVKSGFQLAQWVWDNCPELKVRIAASVDGVARTAAELCETGPHLKRGYEPETVINYVRQLRVAHDRVAEGLRLTTLSSVRPGPTAPLQQFAAAGPNVRFHF